MKTPQPLKKGDKVAIICPASHISVDMTKAYQILIDWGLEPLVYPSTTSEHFQFAGNDTLRAEDFQRALDDSSIKAIIAGRGGYGCVRIIDQIDFSSFVDAPKWVVGFSDVTTIHSHIQKNFGIPTIHGQMVKSFLDATAESLQSLYEALFGGKVDLHFEGKNFANRTGKVTGKLVGGNLAILHSLIGSASDIDYVNNILFIEDVGESHYNIDRMLYTLKRADKLKNLGGLIVGGFTSFKDSKNTFGQRYEEIIMDKVQEYDFPIAFDCPAGHIEDNRALVLGKTIELDVNLYSASITYK